MVLAIFPKNRLNPHGHGRARRYLRENGFIEISSIRG
jgi:hypothetical protein